MEQIIQANEGILKILGTAKTSDTGYRMLKYCLSTPTEEGTLLFNVLTRELLLLTPEEFAGALDSGYLRRQWFVVPCHTDEKKLVGLVRWLQSAVGKKPGYLNDFTIFTTTDCNARCFYCFELGRSRIPMSEETADKTVAFILANYGGKKVRLNWFGGEPLMNVAVIDRICTGLEAAGVDFISHMVSNAYLFSDELVARAKTLWKLKRVQITVDGTEEVYNRCKAYVYRQGSAYQVVMSNIGRLLDAGIGVSARLNMDSHNADNLLELADEMAQRFAGREGLGVYAHLIFNDKKAWDQRHTLEQWTRLYEIRQRLEEKLSACGLNPWEFARLKRELPVQYCMADNRCAVTILPDGHLGRCEHYTESEFVGHLDSAERDQAVIAAWQARIDELPACKDCFNYPQCVTLKKCPDRMECIEPERETIRRHTQQAMINELRFWREGASETGSEEELR